MKKNITLALLALICALGSAIASKIILPSPTWIKGTTIAGIATCSTLGNVCNPTPSSTVNCKIVVTLANGTLKATVGYSTQSMNICSAPHKDPNTYSLIARHLINVETYF